MTDRIPLPPPDHTEDVQGFVHDTQRHYYAEETMRAYAERLHAARVNSPAIMQAIGLLTTLQSWIGARSPQDSGPEEQTLWDQIEATRIALTPLAPAGAALPANPMDWPLPCDVTVGHGTMRKGVPLSTLVTRMKVLYEMATGKNADEVANRTLAQRLALRDDFLALLEGPTCPECNGTGVDGDVGNDGRIIDVTCGSCDGTGRSAQAQRGGA